MGAIMMHFPALLVLAIPAYSIATGACRKQRKMTVFRSATLVCNEGIFYTKNKNLRTVSKFGMGFDSRNVNRVFILIFNMKTDLDVYFKLIIIFS